MEAVSINLHSFLVRNEFSTEKTNDEEKKQKYVSKIVNKMKTYHNGYKDGKTKRKWHHCLITERTRCTCKIVQ